MTRLLLFTNDYPYRSGDAVFVMKEIDALSQSFGEIVVFSNSRDVSVGMLPLPENVRYGGNLFGSTPAQQLRWMRYPSAWGMLLRAAWKELRQRRLLTNLPAFLSGVNVGLAQAFHRRVRSSGVEEGTVLYAFWAMGGGLAAPWVRGVSARVVRVHRYDLYEEEAPSGYLPYRRFLFSRADRILAVSRDGEKYLSERYPQTHGRVSLSRLGVSGPLTAPERVDDGVRTIVSCSAVSEVKRVDRILATLMQLTDLEANPVRWVHFGDGPLMPQLRSQLTNLPPGLSVELRGQVINDEITAFYATGTVDLFINLSSSEGVPVSIMEAIAYGIPAVATAVGGSPEIVGGQLGTGVLVPKDSSPTATAAQIDRVFRSPDNWRPRDLWSRDYDARVTGEHAARLVRTAGEQKS